MKATFVELVLTCASWQEAQTITDALLSKRLVACVEQMEIRSKNWWQGAIEDTKEIKLVMISLAEKFKAVEAEVATHHSYETFVLQAIPVTQLSEAATRWLNESLEAA